MTPSESLLWRELRANRTGLHFRRAQVIGNFIVDFYCDKARLVIEVDGLAHALRERQDRTRGAILEKSGVEILRIPNADVLKDPNLVAQYIAERAFKRIQKIDLSPNNLEGEEGTT